MDYFFDAFMGAITDSDPYKVI